MWIGIVVVLWPYQWKVMGSNLGGQRISFIFAILTELPHMKLSTILQRNSPLVSQEEMRNMLNIIWLNNWPRWGSQGSVSKIFWRCNFVYDWHWLTSGLGRTARPGDLGLVLSDLVSLRRGTARLGEVARKLERFWARYLAQVIMLIFTIIQAIFH